MEVTKASLGGGLYQQLRHPDKDVFKTILKILGLFAFLYLFILSISLLGDAFKLFGKDFARSLLATTSHPLIGLFIGILATSIIQSSSTTSSIVVGLVGGGMLNIECAIPIIMGANIGTTVTNTIVSLTHITHGDEYRRAYSGAVVHDIFNLLSVMVLFPLQLTTGFLSKMALYFEKILENMGGLAFGSPIKIITKPLIEIILNACGQSGWVSAGVAILLLIIALRYMVKILKSMVLSRVERFFQRYVFKTTFRALMLGLILTGIVQSSSITTSLIVPLVGAGVLSLNRVYPFTLGANVGTTVTAIMAAMVTVNSAALAVALAHLLFNICGIIIWLPLKRIPIKLAELAGGLVQISKFYPIGLTIVIFFALPLVLIYILR